MHVQVYACYVFQENHLQAQTKAHEHSQADRKVTVFVNHLNSIKGKIS